MTTFRRSWLASVAGAALLWACAGLAPGGTVMGSRVTSRERVTPEQAHRYYVFQVIGSSGDVTFEVVSDLENKQRARDYEEEFKKALEEWARAKREAKKNKEEFSEPAPKGPKLGKKMAQSFRKEEDARAYAGKLQKQWDEMLEKKRAKEEGTKEGK